MIIDNDIVSNMNQHMKSFIALVEQGPQSEDTQGEKAHRHLLMAYLDQVAAYVNVAQMEIDPDSRAQIVRENR